METDVLVTEIAFAYPSRAARATSAQPLSKKPAARIITTGDDARERTLFVPVRVARLVEQDELDLPLPYRTLRAHVFAREDEACFTALVEMLARRDHARAEAARKLTCAGYRPESVEAALSRAHAARYLDDARFCVQFIEERKRRGWGRRKIEHELIHRGVALEDLEGYPERFFSADDDLERARAILARKRVPESRAFEKLARHLIAKGFSYEVASEATRERLAERERNTV